ncbi:ABC transporter permease [Rhodococcus sp. NPDC060084]|uniref:ABC transporter permease n=1 Tax=Rhodococcus sp. NPDC060084 TaxID=3347053 RepID=UPI0036507161
MTTTELHPAAPPPGGGKTTTRRITRPTLAPGTRQRWGVTALAVTIAIVLSMILVTVTGGSPAAVVRALYIGSVGDSVAWSQTLLNTAPLLLVALGAAVAGRAGVFNIGQEGQVLLGALGGTFVALFMAGPPLLVVPVGLLAGALLGGGLAGVSSLLHRWRGVNVVVSTLLLSFVAIQFVTFAVNTPWLLQEPVTTAGATASPQSAPIPAEYRLPAFGEYPGLVVGLGLVLAVALAIGTSLLLDRTRWGFRIRMLGLNPKSARHAGVRVGVVAATTLIASGAFAGLAGAVIVETMSPRLQPAVSNNFGWDGLLVALIARQRPLAAVPVAVAFGALRTGANFLASTGVPLFLVNVVQALLVLAFVIAPAITTIVERRAVSEGPR